MTAAADFQFDDRGLVVPCGACGQKNRLAYERLADPVRCGRCKQPLGAPGVAVDVHDPADFDRLVARSPLPLIVDYWAPWCAPCRMVAPELQKLAAKHAGRMLLVKVNTDELPDLGERFSIRSIPTLAVFAGGKEVGRTSGARPAEEIERFVTGVTSLS